MPRIPHVGEFDWDFPNMTKGGLLGGSDNLCLLFRLNLDSGEPRNAIHESTGYMGGRNANPERCGYAINPVLDTKALVIPEIAKTIGALISKQDWTRGLIVSCAGGSDGQVSFLVASGFSESNPIRLPTKFINSVVRKVTKELKNQEVPK